MAGKLKNIAKWIIEETCNESTNGNSITSVDKVERKYGLQLSSNDIDTINILMAQDQRVLCVSEPEDVDFNIIVGTNFCSCYEDEKEMEEVA